MSVVQSYKLNSLFRSSKLCLSWFYDVIQLFKNRKRKRKIVYTCPRFMWQCSWKPNWFSSLWKLNNQSVTAAPSRVTPQKLHLRTWVKILRLFMWMLSLLSHSIISKCSRLTYQFSWKEETQMGLRVFILDQEHKKRDYLFSERLVQVIIWLLVRSKESKDKASVNEARQAGRHACFQYPCVDFSLLILFIL